MAAQQVHYIWYLSKAVRIKLEALNKRVLCNENAYMYSPTYDNTYIIPFAAMNSFALYELAVQVLCAG